MIPKEDIKKTAPESKDPINRRDFLKTIWKGLGIIAAIEVVGGFSAFIFSGKSKNVDAAKHLFEAGAIDLFVPESVTAFMGGRFYLARQKDGGFIALSMKCTHLGCAIAWEEKHKRFVCPCHASAFSMKGEVLNPPAARPLDYYPVMIENGIVKVDINKITERNSFRKEQLLYSL